MVHKICALIPAAGKGSRLGLDVPKILVPLTATKKIWHVLYEKISPKVDHVHVIVSPEGFELFQQQLQTDDLSGKVSVSVQEKAIGMGDAIFGSIEHWQDFDNILVVWGDQVNISDQTLEETVILQLSTSGNAMTLPMNLVSQPYVQYLFDNNHTVLQKVLQSREGDQCDAKGYQDVGVFSLSTDKIIDDWREFLRSIEKGKKTQEINFLPFLPFLSSEKKWPINLVMVGDPDESRGINTQEDLEYFRKQMD